MIRVAQLGDLEEGKLKLVRAGAARIVLVLREGQLYAVSAICTHAKILVAPGRLTKEGLIECPMHGARFSPIDGRVHCGPATIPLVTYETALIGDEIFVDPGPEKMGGTENTTTPGARQY